MTPQERPRRARERPKRSQDHPKSAPGAKKTSKMSFGSRLAPGSPPGAILEPFPSLRGAFFERFGSAFWLAFSTPRRFIFEGLRQRPGS